MRGPQQRHVIPELPFADQRAAETGDRLIGDRQQSVESNSELLGQQALVVGLELRLRWRQGRPLRVVDEIQRESRAGLAVAQCIQSLQRPDAPVENSLAALAIDVLLRIAWQ